MKQKKGRSAGNCSCMDFFESANSDRLYPFLYCHLMLEGNFDWNNFQEAVRISANYVPEIFSTYDFRRAKFVKKNFTVEDLFTDDLSSNPRWDLSSNPQVKLSIHQEEKQKSIMIGMSHILADGAGFKQYLYLLAALYNREKCKLPIHNNRAIDPVLKGIRVGKPTEQIKQNRGATMSPLRQFNDGTEFFCLSSTLSPDELMGITEKYRNYGATRNDIWIAAYARVIAGMQKISVVAIPCPADLRRYGYAPDSMTIGNVTGTYQTIFVEVQPGDTFADTVLQVHIEMLLQKSRNLCFRGIRPLTFAFRTLPHSLVKHIIKSAYRIPPVSYTNIGVIDADKLQFDGCHIENCFITGLYRLPPDFQLSVSIFRGTGTLNCALIGNKADRDLGQHILKEVKRELLR